MTRIQRIAPAIALLALLTACSTTPDTSTPNDTPAALTDNDTSSTANPMDTATVIEATWNQKTPAERDTMCQGIDQFGTGWAAVAMKAGAEKSDPAAADAIDWDLAALLVQQKCENR